MSHIDALKTFYETVNKRRMDLTVERAQLTLRIARGEHEAEKKRAEISHTTDADTRTSLDEDLEILERYNSFYRNCRIAIDEEVDNLNCTLNNVSKRIAVLSLK